MEKANFDEVLEEQVKAKELYIMEHGQSLYKYKEKSHKLKLENKTLKKAFREMTDFFAKVDEDDDWI